MNSNKSTIVETNIILENGIIYDHQSRVLEIDSWDDYCNMFINYNGIPDGAEYKNIYGILLGNSIPKDCKIENLKYDDFHLSCDFHRYGSREVKLVYKVG